MTIGRDVFRLHPDDWDLKHHEQFIDFAALNLLEQEKLRSARSDQ